MEKKMKKEKKNKLNVTEETIALCIGALISSDTVISVETAENSIKELHELNVALDNFEITEDKKEQFRILINEAIRICKRDKQNFIDELLPENIEAEREKHKEQLKHIKETKLKSRDIKWMPLHPNNMPVNGLIGYYTLIFKESDTENGKFDCLKWTIVFQYRETRTGITTNEVQAYALYKASFKELDVIEKYPEPSNNIDLFSDELFCDCGVNTYGEFIHAYLSLTDAKIGALNRCAWYRYNKETIIKR